MHFSDFYKENNLIPDEQYCIQDKKIIPGTYNRLIKFLTQSDMTSLQSIWSWRLDNSLLPIASNMFGDIFLLSSTNNAIYFFQPQGASIIYLCEDLDIFLNDALCNSNIILGLLKQEKLRQLYKKNGEVKFNEVFILTPWQILGGTDAIDNYTIGDQLIYHDLVSQTIEKYSKK